MNIYIYRALNIYIYTCDVYIYIYVCIYIVYYTNNYTLLQSNVAGWKIPYINGGFNGQVIYK